LLNEDYVINDNRVIIWLKIDLVETGTIYYVDIVRQVIVEGTGNERYFVKSVNENIVELTQRINHDIRCW
jgi:hypothetical protein